MVVAFFSLIIFHTILRNKKTHQLEIFVRKQSASSLYQKSTIFQRCLIPCGNRSHHKTQSDWKIPVFSHQLLVEIFCHLKLKWYLLWILNIFLINDFLNLSFSFNENQLLLTVIFYHFFTQSQIEQFQRTQEKHSHEPFLINRKRWRGDGSLAKTMRAIFRCFFFLRFVLLVCAFTATFFKTLMKRTATRKRIHRRTLSFFLLTLFIIASKFPFFSLSISTLSGELVRGGRTRDDF